jgi:D-hydroxyproline dehydrogenase subunit beta
MSQSRGRVAIVGAGIVGAACARALAVDGFAVVVLDDRPIGSGATAAGMGHIVAMDDSEAQFALCRRSQVLWDELALEHPPGVESTRSGTLWVAADSEEMAEVGRKAIFYAERGVEAYALDAMALAEAEPNLRPGLLGGLRVPGDSVVYPPCAAAYLIEEAAKLGAEVRLNAPVEAIGGGRVRLADGSTVEADFVINAAGARATRLTPGLAIRPRKGHLVITDRHPGFVTHQILELGYLKSAHGSDPASVAFNVQPRATGQLLIGSSRQYDVEDPAVEPSMVRKMIDRALLYMPGLANLSAIRTWTGFRAATPDSLPIIGPHPEDPRLLLAAGHEGLGITTSLGTAELIADHLAGRDPAIPAEPYLPSRFLDAARVGMGHG